MNGAAVPACDWIVVISGMSASRAARSASVRSVSSTEVPRGMSSITASSDLLSNGRSLTVTALVVKKPIEATVSAKTASRNAQDRAFDASTGRATAR